MMSNTVYGYRLLKNHCLLDHPKKAGTAHLNPLSKDLIPEERPQVRKEEGKSRTSAWTARMHRVLDRTNDERSRFLWFLGKGLS
jgi:hypothetical protein